MGQEEKRILLVDDEVNFLLSATDMLKKEEPTYEMFTAGDDGLHLL